jgi:hypothetical protein
MVIKNIEVSANALFMKEQITYLCNGVLEKTKRKSIKHKEKYDQMIYMVAFIQ